eukprot:362560-Chlamydomonas_euryale.AAC.3
MHAYASNKRAQATPANMRRLTRVHVRALPCSYGVERDGTSIAAKSTWAGQPTSHDSLPAELLTAAPGRGGA